MLKRLQNGNKAAAREFYSLYADYLAGVCARYIADKEDLKDVFQEALIRIFTNIGQFSYQGEGSLRAWAARITVNESLKFLRASQRRELVRLETDFADEDDEDDPPIDDIPPDAIGEMLGRLPEGYRTVFNLYAAFDPYTAVAAASFRMENDSISLGSMRRNCAWLRSTPSIT